MDRIFSYIALRDTLAPDNSPVLSPDRKEEIKTLATAAIYIFAGRFPEFFESVIPEDPEPKPGLPEETRQFVSFMLKEFVACYTLSTVYAASDAAFSDANRRKAAEIIDSLSSLSAPITMLF